MSDSAHAPAKSKPGFTIIEVLIVLAIAGLILLIIFLAVPALQRNSRDVHRKEATSFIASQMHEYYNNHNGSYPLTDSQDERDAFKAEVQSGTIVENYTIRYTDYGTAHEYPFSGGGSPSDPLEAADIISIAPGHQCNRDPSVGPGDSDYPLQLTPDGHHHYRQYATWVYLEAGVVYCIDSIN